MTVGPPPVGQEDQFRCKLSAIGKGAIGQAIQGPDEGPGCRLLTALLIRTNPGRMTRVPSRSLRWPTSELPI